MRRVMAGSLGRYGAGEGGAKGGGAGGVRRRARLSEAGPLGLLDVLREADGQRVERDGAVHRVVVAADDLAVREGDGDRDGDVLADDAGARGDGERRTGAADA